MPPLGNITNKGTANSTLKVVPSRAFGENAKGGMPSLRSQLDRAKLAQAAAEAAAKLDRSRASRATTELRCIRSTLVETDRQLEEAVAAARSSVASIGVLNSELQRREGIDAHLAECQESLALERSRVAELEAQIQLLRDVTLPGALRANEELSERAERSERRSERSDLACKERDVTLHGTARTLAQLRRILLDSEDGDGIAALAARALGSFGELFATVNGLHNDPRFAAAQDDLVALSLMADSLTQWLPQLLTSHEAETSAHVDSILSAAADGESCALSPELLPRRYRDPSLDAALR